MTTFAARTLGAKQKQKRGIGIAMATLGAMLGMAGLSTPAANADTIGGAGLTGNGILRAFGYTALTNRADGTAIDLTSTNYGYIANDYIGFVQGISGSFSENYGTNFSVTYNIPGFIAFGNRKGSLLRTQDDNKSLTGFNPFQTNSTTTTTAYPVFPLASNGELRASGYYDYSGYVSALIDNARKDLGVGSGAAYSATPVFHDNVLDSTYDLGTNVKVRQVVRLLRQTARIEWTITNGDTASHTVGLRLALNLLLNRGNRSSSVPTGIYYVDPTVGQTTRAQVYSGNTVPDQLDVLESRTDATSNFAYHARHTLRGFDATVPDQVLVSDSNFLDPIQAGTYAPQINTAISPGSFQDGLATALYWNATGLQPGGSRTIVTYFGNGSATEDLSTLSYVTGTEALESVGYDTTGVTDASLANPTGVKNGVVFYNPKTLTVFGSIYNRSLAEPQFQTTLKNVSMSLNLPTGLAFAPVSNGSGGTTTDTAQKVIGDVLADKDAQASWVIQPTGENYGALAYQMVTSIPGVAQSSITRVINVPASPFKAVSANGFQMISVPFTFNPVTSNNADPTTVLGTSADNPVVLYRWKPEIQSYGQPVTTITNGYSYFYKPNLSRTVYAKGVLPVDNQAPATNILPTPVQITLRQGWNMIGNPYVYTIPLNYVQLISPDNLALPYSFSDAVNAGLVRGGVFFRNASLSGYDFLSSFTDPIVPWEGYWVYANTDNLLLKYLTPSQVNSVVTGPRPSTADPNGGTTRKVKRGALESRAALFAHPTMENWKIQLVARKGDNQQDDALLLGVSTRAKDTDNIMDLPKPPATYSNYVYTGIVRDKANTRFMQDLKAANGGTKTWDVEVKSDEDGPVTLLWPNVGTLPRRLRLKLTDMATGRSTNLRGASSITVNVSRSEPHRFQITAQTAPSQPLAITGVRSLGGATRGQGSGIAWGLNVNQEATLTARVLTTNGKVVKNIVQGRAATAGDNRLTWNGRSENNVPLPAGQYQLEITATTDDGQVARQTKPFMTIR